MPLPSFWEVRRRFVSLRDAPETACPSTIRGALIVCFVPLTKALRLKGLKVVEKHSYAPRAA